MLRRSWNRGSSVSESGSGYLRRLGVWDAAMVVVGGIIGAALPTPRMPAGG